MPRQVVSKPTMATLRSFPVKKVFQAHRYRASRQAILSTLVSARAVKRVAYDFTVLRKQWVTRTAELSVARWKPASTCRQLYFLNNCPPFGVSTDVQQRVCNRDHICPYCRGRYLQEQFTKLETLLYGDPFLDNLLDSAVRIAWFRTEGWVKPPQCELSVATTPVFVRELLSHVRKHRQREAGLFDILGGPVQIAVYPESAQKRLGFVRAGVFIVAGTAWPQLEQLRNANKIGKVETLAPTRANLCKAFVAAFAYPSKLMTEPADLTATMLNALHGARLATCYSRGTASVTHCGNRTGVEPGQRNHRYGERRGRGEQGSRRRLLRQRAGKGARYWQHDPT